MKTPSLILTITGIAALVGSLAWIGAASSMSEGSHQPPSPTAARGSQVLPRASALALTTTSGEPARAMSLALLQHRPAHLLSAIMHEMQPDEVAATLAEWNAAMTRAQTKDAKQQLAALLAASDHPDALQALADACHRAASPEARAAIAESLGSFIGIDPEAREIVTSMVALSTDPALVTAAAKAIERSADADTVQFLAELYNEPGTSLQGRTQLLQALSALSNEQATPGLAALLAQPGHELRQAAAQALAHIGTPASFAALMEAATAAADLLQLEPMLEAIQTIHSPHLAAALQTAADSAQSPLLRKVLSQALTQVASAQ